MRYKGREKFSFVLVIRSILGRENYLRLDKIGVFKKVKIVLECLENYEFEEIGKVRYLVFGRE